MYFFRKFKIHLNIGILVFYNLESYSGNIHSADDITHPACVSKLKTLFSLPTQKLIKYGYFNRIAKQLSNIMSEKWSDRPHRRPKEICRKFK